MIKHTLLLGSNTPEKDKHIAQIKKQLFDNEQALRFDFDTLYGNKISGDVLKQALIALPAMARKRLVLLRELKKLSADNQKLLLAFLEESNDHVVLICDGEAMEATTALSKKLKPYMNVVDFNTGKPMNIFDVTNALGYGKRIEALKALNALMSEGQHPLQLMGGLVWFWGKQKTRLSRDKYKKGLLEIQEADIHIKRSRLKAEYALETLVTKMSLLMQS